MTVQFYALPVRDNEVYFWFRIDSKVFFLDRLKTIIGYDKYVLSWSIILAYV